MLAIRLYLVIGGSLIGKNEQLASDYVTEAYYPGDLIGLDDFILKVTWGGKRTGKH